MHYRMGNVQHVDLRLDEALKLSLRSQLLESGFAPANVEVRSWIDSFTGQFVYEVTAILRGREVQRDVEKTTHVAADWWQAVRQRWLPRWWLRRHPIRTHAIDTLVRKIHICPHREAPNDHIHVAWLAPDVLKPKGGA